MLAFTKLTANIAVMVADKKTSKKEMVLPIGKEPFLIIKMRKYLWERLITTTRDRVHIANRLGDFKLLTREDLKSFQKNELGQWVCTGIVSISGNLGVVSLPPGKVFVEGDLFMGVDIASELELLAKKHGYPQ